MSAKKTDPCPDPDELQAFANGRVQADQQFERIASHIEDCHACGLLLDHPSWHDDEGLVDDLLYLTRNPPAENQRQVGIAGDSSACCVANGTDPTIRMRPLAPGMGLPNQSKKDSRWLGRYQLMSELGTGSSGCVYRAWDSKLQRQVAVKVLRSGVLATDEERSRFLSEAQNVAKLNHPGIVRVHDSLSTEDGICYQVSELIEGKSLDQALGERSFHFDEIATLIAQICDAVQAAHDANMVHRDLKPSNILIDDAGKPFVADFGLAKQIDGLDSCKTTLGRILGTPAYMSPEQTMGDSDAVDCRSDIYSLGTILYQLLTGETPFRGHPQILLQKIAELEPRNPRELNSKIPRDLATICLKALEKSTRARYQSAAALAEDLRRFLHGEPITAKPKGVARRLWQWCRSYPAAATLLLVTPMVSLGGFAYLSHLSTDFVRRTALESTRMETNMLEDINEHYSESVSTSRDFDIFARPRWDGATRQAPLPFTFMIEAGRRISQGESGMKVKVFSDYPWRQDSVELDEFEKQAIDAVGLGCRTQEHENEPSTARVKAKQDIDGRSYYQFVEIDGEPALRYARAQVMKRSCIECHNRDPASPKRNWVEGEVAGFLSVTRPLQRDIATTEEGLRSAFHLIGGFALAFSGASLLVFWNANRKRTASEGAAK